MIKRFSSLFLALLLIAVGAAIADQPLYDEPEAYSVIPSSAEFVRNTTDDGLNVAHYLTPDGTRWEVKTEPSGGRTVKVEIEAADRRGAAEVSLTREQAEAALLALWPDASVYLTTLERDDGRSEYDVYFTTPAFSGRAELHASTGALLEAELNYVAEARTAAQGSLTADEARALVLSLVQDGTIAEFETDREDGRKVYEGEVRSSSGRYEFVIDAETGRVTEWERDN